MADDLQTQTLGLGRLAVMLAGKRHQALGQADEAVVSVPCFSTSRCSSVGESFSESIQTPWPMRNGALYTFLRA